MIKKILIFFFIIFSSFGLAGVIYPHTRNLMLKSGIIQVQINIAGTGSMYPTFPKGDSEDDVVNAKEIVAWPQMMTYPSGFSFFGMDLLNYRLKHLDIVEFENELTRQKSKEKYGEEAGFVKRIIAIPEDDLMLKDGFVYLNGKMLEEPYTAKPRSTYGGDSIPDCKHIKVPQGSVVVMGDNRKASQDSRYEIGFVPVSDIHYVLPFEKQDIYRHLWRDASRDFELGHTATFNEEEFLRILNEKRKEKKIPSLKIAPALTLSSKRRGKVMIDTNDFSTEATKSGVGMAKAIKESGYRNILLAESSTVGYYEAEELIENFLEFPQTKKILMSSEYQDIGVSPYIGDLNGCPTQVVVLHMGGYKPPNYSKSDLESWQNLINNMNQVIPSWEEYIKIEGSDKVKGENLLNLINRRKFNAEKILKRMKANEWLNDDEEKAADDDRGLAEEINRLIGELNK